MCFRLLTGAILAALMMLFSPAATAQQPDRDAEYAGGGAALCIAAGELLAASPSAPLGVEEDVLRWRQVLYVVDGTPEQGEGAIASARSSWVELELQRPGLGVAGARGIWSSACFDEMQIRYIAVHGSERRARFNLAEDPNEPLDRAVVHRLNVAASCLVAAELFASERPNSRLRRALRGAAPTAPDRAALNAIQERARQEISASPGSAVGKTLVVEYLRYLYDTSAGEEAPQQFVNRASETLQMRCVERQTEAHNG